MIKVYRVPISKKQLSTLPKDERALLLLMGQALNQISVFLKLFSFSSNKDPENPIEERVSAAQSHIILRVLFGVLFEAWKVVLNNQVMVDKYMPNITAVRSISEQIQLVSYLGSNAFGGVVGKRLI
jgi:hypothetical protein